MEYLGQLYKLRDNLDKSDIKTYVRNCEAISKKIKEVIFDEKKEYEITINRDSTINSYLSRTIPYVVPNCIKSYLHADECVIMLYGQHGNTFRTFITNYGNLLSTNFNNGNPRYEIKYIVNQKLSDLEIILLGLTIQNLNNGENAEFRSHKRLWPSRIISKCLLKVNNVYMISFRGNKIYNEGNFSISVSVNTDSLLIMLLYFKINKRKYEEVSLIELETTENNNKN